MQGVDGVADVGEVRHGAAQDRGAGAAVVVRQPQPALPQDEANEDSCNNYIQGHSVRTFSVRGL